VTSSDDGQPAIPAEIQEAAERLREGETLPPITVRQLLTYFGAKRRGFYVVEYIRDILNSLQIKSDPDFQDVWIDAEIRLLPVSHSEASAEDIAEAATEVGDSEGGTDNEPATGTTTGNSDHASRDPTLRIGALDAANREVVSVKPDEPLSLAITRMLAKDYSQLPVMTNPRSVKGIISWSSIGAGITLNNKGTAVRHQMEKAYIVDTDEALLDALPIIVERGYVLVRATDSSITGIVTAADVSMEFKQRAEPFLLLSEIEQHVRNLMEGKISVEELRTVKNPTDKARSVDRVADLTFFEYVLIFQNPTLWQKIEINGVNREEFVVNLEKIVQIRNEVMHINPDPLGKEDLEVLQKYAKFLQRLRNIRAADQQVSR
jgi:CBS domain-containing protein